jgi:TorA maturation chaperone TorD
VDQATETVNANLYLVLSRAFSSPTVMEQDDVARLRQLSPGLPAALQEAALSLADEWERGLTRREELALAYARLFLGPFEILASPYASFYLEPDQRLMGEVSRSVAGFYVEAGLDPGPGPREAPDHVALEWEFMYFLTTGEDHWIERRQAFAATHLARWIPSLAGAIKRAGQHAFYDALAVLLTSLHPETASL